MEAVKGQGGAAEGMWNWQLDLLSAAQLLVVSFGSVSLPTAGAGKDTQMPAAAWFLAGNKPFFQFLS